MVETVFRGPAYSAGSMMDGRLEPMDGPGLTYQADAFVDPRYFPTRKDGMYPGRVPGWMNSPYSVLADAVPSALGTATIAPLANAVSGTPMVLTSVAPGGANAGTASLAPVPIVPLFGRGAGGPAVNVLAIDFGFTTGTTVASSATVTVPDSSVFFPGEWICIGGVGNSAKTSSLMTQVLAAPTATTITVSSLFLPAAALSNAPIGRTNLTMGALAPFVSAGNIQQVTPTGVFPYTTAGLASLFNSIEGLARGVSVTGVVGGVGGAFIVRGYDIYGQPMAETITATAGATTVFGKKAFKYIASVTPQFSDAHTYSIGTSDVFGINLRSDKFEYLQLYYNGQFVAGNGAPGPVSGWTQALQPPSGAATATSADVRGTWQVSTLAQGGGPLTPTFTGVAATTGAIRLQIAMTVPLFNGIAATPINTVPLLGLPQFTQ